MPRSHNLMLIALALASLGGSMTFGQDARTVRTFEELGGLIGALDSDRQVDLVGVVNFWDPGSHMLFVQKGEIGIFVDFPTEQYGEPSMFVAGDRIRIRGVFSAERDCLEATSLSLVEHGEPNDPSAFDIDTLATGWHWSDRVQVTGMLRQFVNAEDGVVLVLKGQTKYCLVRVAHESDPERLSALIGAEVTVVGTMDWVSDEFGRATTPMCLLMSAKDLTAGTGPPITEPRKVSLDQLTVGDLAGVSVQTTGLISQLISRQLLLLESNGRDGVLLECVDAFSLLPGDVVRVTGEVSADARQPTLVASRIERQMSDIPLPPTRMSVAAILAGNTHPQRAAIEADFLSVKSRGNVRTLTLADEGAVFSARLLLEDDDFDSLELDRARRVTVAGAVVRSEDPAVAFVVHGEGPDALLVSETWVQFDRARVTLFVGTGFFLLTVGACMIWFLRSQVRKQTRALTGMTAQLNSAFEAVREGLVVLDKSGEVVSSNGRMVELFSAREGTGVALKEHLAAAFAEPEAFSEFWNSVSTGSGETRTATFATADNGQYIAYTAPIFSGQQVSGRLWAFEDISERSELEARLVQSQKMEAVGRLAGGVAHDFNNLLMGISGNLELMRNATGFDHQQAIDAAEAAADRAATLVEHLVGFSKRTALNIVPVNPNEIVSHLTNLASQPLQQQLNLQLDSDDTIWPVEADRVQVEQVLLNLCLNARDAIADETGSITIQTANVHDEALGDCVRISVEDTGPGMSDEVTARIFEPFFTTKETGKGTGLGLAMSYGIINQHRGRIDVTSQSGLGSRFDIFLPRSDKKPMGDPDACRETLQLHATASGLGHVLIADDEQVVREAAAAMLTLAGYTVSTATNGAEALAQLESGARVDLLVLDLSMPVLSGRETLAAVSASNRELPVVLCTGFLLDSDRRNLTVHDNLVDVLTKPFRADDLLQSVHAGLQWAEARQARDAETARRDVSGRVQSL